MKWLPTKNRTVARPRAVVSKRNAVLARWGDFFLLICAGLVASIALFPILSPLARVSVKIAENWTTIGAIVAGTAITTILLFALIEMRGFHLAHFRYLLLYPPTWIAGVMAAALLSISADIFNGNSDIFTYRFSAWLEAATVLCASVLCASLIHAFAGAGEDRFIRLPAITRTDSNRTEGLWKDPARLLKWIRQEEPIADPADDVFGKVEGARRIASRINDNPHGTLAVVGAYGSGKSSLLRLVQGFLNPRNWLVSYTGGWGIAPNAAVEHVLERVLDALSSHVDCLSLKALPRRYRAALGGVEGPIGKLISPFVHTEDPAEVLRRLDAVLASTGKYLIILMEDLDRSESGPKALHELCSLLDRLRNLERISFVLAVGRDFSSAIDLTKLCEYIEWLPPLGAGITGKILRTFYDRCASAFLDDVQVVSRANSDIEQPNDALLFHASADEAETKLVASLSSLLTTPRLLKHCLRRTWDAWQNLHGEISLTDLLVGNAIRASAPAAFDFLVQTYYEIHAIRDSMENRIIRDSQKREQLRKALHDRLRTVAEGHDWNFSTISYLIGYLLPLWINDDTVDQFFAAGEQRVAAKEYWGRFLSERLENPDQLVLRSLTAWVANPSNDSHFSARFTADGNFSHKVEQFAALLPTKLVRLLASKVFAEMTRVKGISASADDSPGFLSVWRIALKQGEPSARAALFVLREVEQAMPKSLKLAQDIEYYWASSESAHMLLDRHAIRVRRGFEAIAKRELTSAERIVKLIDPALPYMLHQLIRHQHLKIPPMKGDWNWLLPSLLQAAKLKPHLMIPQLAVLCSRSQTHRRSGLTEQNYWLDDEFVEGFFKNSQQRTELYRILSQWEDDEQLNLNTKALVRAVSDSARQRLKQEQTKASP